MTVSDAELAEGGQEEVNPSPGSDAGPAKPRTIVMTCMDAGGGHKATLRALTEIFRRQQRPWIVDVVDLDAVTRRTDPFYLVGRLNTSAMYNGMLAKNLTIGHRYMIGALHGSLATLYPFHLAVIRKRLRALQPDLVLSITPHFNRALFQAMRHEAPAAKFVTLPTDFIDHPPRFWFDAIDQYAICGTEVAAEQARAFVPSADRIIPVSGMVVHPRFFDPIEGDRAAERVKLGLDPQRPTVLVFFGGAGSARMFDIASHISRANPAVQLIMLCGRNHRLAARLRQFGAALPMHVEEFTTDVPRFMWLSDLVVGKPGPGAISEALAMRLPVILQNDSRTLWHERYNVRWVEQKGVGIGVTRVDDISGAIATMLDPEHYRLMRDRIDAVSPRAVFEVPGIIETILESDAHASVAPARRAAAGARWR